MNAKKLHAILLAVLLLAIAALLGGAYGATSWLQGRAKAVRTARLDSLVLEEKQRQLSKARSDITKYKALSDIARNIVPQDKDQAQTVREIVSIAGAHHITLGSVTFPASTLGDSKVKHSQLKPAPNTPGVFSLEVTVQSDQDRPASFGDVVGFLDALEHNRRTALVNGINILPDNDDPSKLTFTLTLSEYIKP